MAKIASEDTTVRVTLTDLSSPFCIRVEIGDLTLNMHTRSAIDLHRKLGNAVAEWISESAAMLIAEMQGES